MQAMLDGGDLDMAEQSYQAARGIREDTLNRPALALTLTLT